MPRCDGDGNRAAERRGRRRRERRRRSRRLGLRCQRRFANPPVWRSTESGPRRRAVAGGGDDDAGAIGAVEAMLALPIVGALVVSVFQIALLWHAHNIVEAAAQEGSQAAAVVAQTCTDGVAMANEMADRLGGAYVTRISVTCQPGPSVTVMVAGQALSMVPGLHFPVRATAHAATPGER